MGKLGIIVIASIICGTLSWLQIPYVPQFIFLIVIVGLACGTEEV